MELTEEIVLNHARQFKTRKAWIAACLELEKQGHPIYCNWAYKRGKEFFKKCRAHMIHSAIGTERYTKPHAWWRELTDEQLIDSAKKYKTRNEWKLSECWYWVAARAKGEDFYNLCCGHMVAAANPYNTPYSIYAFEFVDRHVYVGLSFQPENRKLGHFKGGPVFDHMQICPQYEWKIVETDIDGPLKAGEAERKWISHYEVEGWQMLNTARGGGTGGIYSKYSDADILEDALKYKTKKAWKSAHHYFWSVSKARGIFEECVAHMPKHAPQPPRVFSEKSRLKMSESAKRRAADPEWRANHSAFMKERMGKLSADCKLVASAETRAKMSQARVGMKYSAETRARMSAAKRGRKLSAANRAALSATALGKKRGQYKVKLSEAEWKWLWELRGGDVLAYPDGTALAYVMLTPGEKTELYKSRR